MTSVKPEVAEATVLDLIATHLPGRVEQVETMPGGPIAQTFAFAVDGHAYILRFTAHMGANLDKELFIQRLLAGSRVPFARILHVSRLGTLHYAISERMPGDPLTTLSPEQYAATIPALMQTLDEIHAVDVSATTGHGIFSDDGTGFFPSWRACLAYIREKEPEWDFYGQWHRLFETTFLEHDVWEALYARMVELLDLCPEARYLVHGGYGYGNVLAQGGRVTAVLDWLDAKYGDFLFDVASLDIWDPARKIAGRFAEHYEQMGLETPHYGERVLCYQCYMALDALRFFAKTGQHDSYQWIRARIASKLEQAGRPLRT